MSHPLVAAAGCRPDDAVGKRSAPAAADVPTPLAVYATYTPRKVQYDKKGNKKKVAVFHPAAANFPTLPQSWEIRPKILYF